MRNKLKTKTSEVKAHSEFGGSQAERILGCPASVKLSRGIPNKTNKASERGTAAHACLEFIVNNRHLLKNPKTRKKVLEQADEGSTVGESGEVHFWDDDMITHALHTLTWIESKMAPNHTLYVEQRLDTSKFTTTGQGSTLDIALANWSARTLWIIDYKYGNYPVKVRWNAQLIYYALGMLIKLKGWKKFDRVVLAIAQPNVSLTPSEWTLSVDSAINWGRRFKKAVKLALGKNPPMKYDDKYCFFCLAKKTCPEMRNKQVAKDFD